jgi:hypothetical protein
VGNSRSATAINGVYGLIGVRLKFKQYPLAVELEANYGFGAVASKDTLRQPS